MLFRKLLVFICPLLILSAMEAALRWHGLIFYALAACGLILLACLKLQIAEKFFSRDFFFLALQPILFFYLGAGFLLFSENSIGIQLALLAGVLILGLALENLYLYYCQPNFYHPNSLQNFSAFWVIVNFFLLALNLYAYFIFVDLPLWLASVILAAITAYLLAQSFWINKIKDGLKFVYLLVLDIIIVEFFWAVSMLPANFYVSGALLAVIFYLLWGVSKNKLEKALTRKNLIRYAVICGLMLFLIIITSRWIS